MIGFSRRRILAVSILPLLISVVTLSSFPMSSDADEAASEQAAESQTPVKRPRYQSLRYRED